ncbi:MAG: ATP-dependent helicase [Firmicutes bacterium]|nr:ATP-dependent helicase [Bacillota bacterium]
MLEQMKLDFTKITHVISAPEKENILHGLTDEQGEAVTFGDGPLLIVAGAGTGKTTVITRRIAHLIASKKCKTDEILALTFTDRAANEMEERVDILVPYGYTDVWISTFHAFGDRILREHCLEIGFNPDFRVLSRPEQLIFLREHLFELPMEYYRPLGDPTRYLDALLALFSRSKDEDISPEEYLAYAQKLEEESMKNPEDEALKDIAEQQKEIAVTYAKYQELMAKAGYIDFGDQVNLVLKLFRTRPAILDYYGKKFKYILVDEFQDTNYAQFEMVKMLGGDSRNITVVGDDDQSIYKFRGAAISNIMNFQKVYSDAKQIVLTRNFRSGQALLDTAYKLICHNNPDRLEVKNGIDKKLKSVHGSGKAVEHRHFDSLSAEAEGAAGFVEEAVKSGLKYGEIAVLVRSNRDADEYLRALNMKSIPFRFSGSHGLYSRDEIILLISFLRTITNFDDSISLYHLSSSELYSLKIQDIVLCNTYANRKNISLYHVMKNLEKTEELEAVTPAGRSEIAKIIEDIEKFTEISGELSCGRLLYKFIIESGYLSRLSKSGKTADDEKIQNIAKFFEGIRRFEVVSESDRVPQFVTHLDLLIAAGENPPTAEVDMDEDAVHVLTVHKAKGLEFPVVIMVGLVADKFPVRGRKEPIELPNGLVKDILPSGDFHLQEERRLFYVGMTRAKEKLLLTSARDYGTARPRKISPFVLEALDIPKADIEVFKTSALEALKKFAMQAEGEDALSSMPEDKILTLSNLQIDDYLTCPLKYKFVHILRVPVLKHHAVVYGKALHDAILEYHKRKMKNEPVTLDNLVEVFERSWVSEGFITREHEEKRLEAGKAVLERFFEKEEAEGLKPSAVEKEFSFLIENNRIIGRWDRIDERDGKVLIIDYKSSDVRTAREANKKTKESLQLSIYALAYKKITGKVVDRVELHFLESGVAGKAIKTEKDLAESEEKIRFAASGIRARKYQAQPVFNACPYCPYREICPRKGGEK